ncbi:ASKHA domain-containing protein [Desulfovibrio sp. OttesenSCG-928-G11]|nr:ASKHA domain-containing protein [Desulfovibrio sp. OttesenSCG-928-G11]
MSGTDPEKDGPWTPIFYDSDQTLAQALFLSGEVSPPVLCSGLARCGRCRVRILTGPKALPPLPDEEDLFSAEELAMGLRLACRRKPWPGLRLELAPESAPDRSRGPGLGKALPPAPARPLDSPEPYADPDEPLDEQAPVLALDFGTTSLQWQLADSRGRALAAGSRINPQMGAGSDVIARIAAAGSPAGLQRLYALSLVAMQEIAAKLPLRPVRICLAANPAMSAIALGLSPSGLACAPYSLPEKGGRWFALPHLPPLWLPPQLSPFVGGDISAGYSALSAQQEDKAPAPPWLLADLGTNCEFLLVLGPERCLAASSPMGPALEGAGLTRGSEARPGTAADFRPAPKGLETGVLDDKGRLLFYAPMAVPALAGITGTGALSLLHLLRQCGLMDLQGRFVSSSGSLMAGSLGLIRNKRGEEELSLPGGLSLCAGDVEELLKVKAAFSLALSRLLREADLQARELTAVYLAGALGGHLRKEVLNSLGFLPPGLEGRAFAVGNAALRGALLLGSSIKERKRLMDWSSTVRALDLAADPSFSADYLRHMSFAWGCD